ncbi:hypothetical protein PLESTF_000494900 [Pleodorina starrii]|nr:hypothetical protein PLESTF_000494900 [Pleodorina starrii]
MPSPSVLRPATQLPFLVPPFSYPLIPLPPTYPPLPTPEPLLLPPPTAYPPNPTLPTYPTIPLPPDASAPAVSSAAPPQGPPSPPRRLRTWPAEMPVPPWPRHLLPDHQPQDVPYLSPDDTELVAGEPQQQQQQLVRRQRQERSLWTYVDPTGFLKE